MTNFVTGLISYRLNDALAIRTELGKLGIIGVPANYGDGENWRYLQFQATSETLNRLAKDVRDNNLGCVYQGMEIS